MAGCKEWDDKVYDNDDDDDDETESGGHTLCLQLTVLLQPIKIRFYSDSIGLIILRSIGHISWLTIRNASAPSEPAIPLRTHLAARLLFGPVATSLRRRAGATSIEADRRPQAAFCFLLLGRGEGRPRPSDRL